MRVVITGKHIGGRAKPYEFADNQTGEKRSGTSYRTWLLVDGGDGEPLELRHQEKDLDAWNAAQDFEFGDLVQYEVESTPTTMNTAYGPRAVDAWTARRATLAG